MFGMLRYFQYFLKFMLINDIKYTIQNLGVIILFTPVSGWATKLRFNLSHEDFSFLIEDIIVLIDTTYKTNTCEG